MVTQGCPPSRIVVAAEAHDDGTLAQAARLAERLRLPLHKTTEVLHALHVLVRSDRIALYDPVHKEGPIFVDFVAGATGFRRRRGRETRTLLGRAVGARTRRRLVIADATAGLGRDAFLLAHMGHKVFAIERNDIVFAMLEDGCRRAGREAGLCDVIDNNLTLMHGDARDLLDAAVAACQVSVIYLDPMFAPKNGSAKAGKEMRLCRLATGDDRDAKELCEAALATSCPRIVVKRRKHALPLMEAPSLVMRGNTMRYDIYLRPCV